MRFALAFVYATSINDDRFINQHMCERRETTPEMDVSPKTNAFADTAMELAQKYLVKSRDDMSRLGRGLRNMDLAKEVVILALETTLVRRK